MIESAKKFIEKLELNNHPEGGYYRETYRSDLLLPAELLHKKIKGSRNCATCIYFLLTSENFSAFHKINQDEIWHFYAGQPVTIQMIYPSGEHNSITIGLDLEKEIFPQYVVPAHTWFAAEIQDKDAYALVGCTVVPGFDYRDFKLAGRSELLALFPQHEELITRFTRS